MGELAALLARELRGLEGELSEVVKGSGVQRLIGEEDGGSVKAGETLLQQMIAKLQAATQSTATITITAPTPPPSSSSTSSSTDAAGQQHHVLSSIDRRVAALERVVGLPVGVLSTPNPTSSSSSKGKTRSSLPSTSAASSALTHTSYSSPYPDLYTAIMTLHRKLLLLDPVRLESLHRNIKTITADLELIQPATAQGGGSSSTSSGPLVDASRSSEMYDVLMRWDGWVGQLPIIVARLRGLRSVVEEAKGWGKG